MPEEVLPPSAPPRPLALGELPRIGPAALCLGAFDGVHLGHQALARLALAAGRRHGARPVALVFEPHPDEVVRPGTLVPRLAPLEENLRRLEQEGVVALPLRFDASVRSLAPEEFLAALRPGIELREMVMTPESAFGRGRAGTPERLEQIGREEGFEVTLLDHEISVDGERVTSSAIRAHLAAGALGRVTRMLGRPAYLSGRVVHGDARGRELGYPTANLDFAYAPALPALGVYVGTVAATERGIAPGHPALISVGVRPTFHTEGRVLVEAHLLDVDVDLYGARLELSLVARLRDERRFADVESLVQQMHADEAEGRRILHAAAHGGSGGDRR